AAGAGDGGVARVPALDGGGRLAAALGARIAAGGPGLQRDGPPPAAAVPAAPVRAGARARRAAPPVARPRDPPGARAPRARGGARGLRARGGGSGVGAILPAPRGVFLVFPAPAAGGGWVVGGGGPPLAVLPQDRSRVQGRLRAPAVPAARRGERRGSRGLRDR